MYKETQKQNRNLFVLAVDTPKRIAADKGEEKVPSHI